MHLVCNLAVLVYVCVCVCVYYSVLVMMSVEGRRRMREHKMMMKKILLIGLLVSEVQHLLLNYMNAGSPLGPLKVGTLGPL